MLVLLTLISTLGGSIYPSEKKIDTFGPHQHEMFNTEYEGGENYQEEDQSYSDGNQGEDDMQQYTEPSMEPSMVPSMEEPMEAEAFVDNMVPQGMESTMSANSAMMSNSMPGMSGSSSMPDMMPGMSGSSSMPDMMPGMSGSSSMPGMSSMTGGMMPQEGFEMLGSSQHHKEEFVVEGFDGEAYAAF